MLYAIEIRRDQIPLNKHYSTVENKEFWNSSMYPSLKILLHTLIVLSFF